MRHSCSDVAKALIDTYKEKAIDSFVRGLDGQVSVLLKNYRPDTLAATYAYCVSYQNTEYRKKLTKSKHTNDTFHPTSVFFTVPPQLPLRTSSRPTNPVQNKFNMPQAQQRFHQHNVPAQNPNIQRATQQIPPPQFAQRPTAQPQLHAFARNPFASSSNKPEPMEVDPSIRSRQINYGNRPQGSTQSNQPQKRPRMFNILSNQPDDDNAKSDLKPEIEDEQEYYDTPIDDPSFERYIQQLEIQEKEESFLEENAEFNFLG